MIRNLLVLLDYKYSRRKRRLLIDNVSRAIEVKNFQLVEDLVTCGLKSRYANVKD